MPLAWERRSRQTLFSKKFLTPAACVYPLPAPSRRFSARIAPLHCLLSGVMESEAPRPPRNSAQLQARMAQLRGMVNTGLLEEEDIAEEVEQLKAEARAWRVSTAASGAVGGCPAASQPQAAAPPAAPDLRRDGQAGYLSMRATAYDVGHAAAGRHTRGQARSSAHC